MLSSPPFCWKEREKREADVCLADNIVPSRDYLSLKLREKGKCPEEREKERKRTATTTLGEKRTRNDDDDNNNRIYSTTQAFYLFFFSLKYSFLFLRHFPSRFVLKRKGKEKMEQKRNGLWARIFFMLKTWEVGMYPNPGIIVVIIIIVVVAIFYSTFHFTYQPAADQKRGNLFLQKNRFYFRGVKSK